MRINRIAGAAVIGSALALSMAGFVSAAAQTSAQPSTRTSAQALVKSAVARVHGTAHIVIYSVNSDGPYFRAVLSGSIGDYGPAVAVYPDGQVDPEHNSELELNLSHGTFRLNIAELDKEFIRHLSNYPDYPATCSDFVGFTIRVPVVAGSGTGSYRGITGGFTLGVAADEALIDAASGVGGPCTSPQGRAWEVIVLGGPGAVSS